MLVVQFTIFEFKIGRDVPKEVNIVLAFLKWEEGRPGSITSCLRK